MYFQNADYCVGPPGFFAFFFFVFCFFFLFPIRAFWGCESESSPHGAATPDLAWAIPPDVECVLGQWRGAARSHAGRPCLPTLPQRAWPQGFCQHSYQSRCLSLVLSHFFLSLASPIHTVFPFFPVSPPSLTLPHPLSLPLSRLLPPHPLFCVFPLTFCPHHSSTLSEMFFST